LRCTAGDISPVGRVLKVRLGVRYPLTTICLAKWGTLGARSWGVLGCKPDMPLGRGGARDVIILEFLISWWFYKPLF